jgi:hypothetical protein
MTAIEDMCLLAGEGDTNLGLPPSCMLACLLFCLSCPAAVCLGQQMQGLVGAIVGLPGLWLCPSNLVCHCAALPAGEADLYLHLRFKDEATAGSLYRKHGFNSAKKDCWLLLLLGQEPRFLMLKQLAAERMLAGQVQLPGFKQGVTAAELQQEQQAQQQQQQDAAAGVGQEGAGEGQAAAAPAASPAA